MNPKILSLIVALGASFPAFADSARYTLGVDGLNCPSCCKSMEKALLKLPGASAVTAELKTGVVTVDVADGSTLTEAQARSATESAGFRLASFRAVESAKD